MIKRIAIVTAFAFFFLALSPVLFRKRTVALVSNGRIVAVATRPLPTPWTDNEFGVYAGGAKVFNLWGDFFDVPLLIYPYADGKRFLCIDDDDTAVLVFIVDLNATNTIALASDNWPKDDYAREHLASRATNVVMATKGIVRLPNYAELREVSGCLMSLTPSQLQTVSFPFNDLGLCRFYCTKDDLLKELNTNRTSVWP
jgi:hypothetical protein